MSIVVDGVEYMTTEEACEQYGISRQQLYDWSRSPRRRTKSVKLDRRCYWPGDDVAADERETRGIGRPRRNARS